MEKIKKKKMWLTLLLLVSVSLAAASLGLAVPACVCVGADCAAVQNTKLGRQQHAILFGSHVDQHQRQSAQLDLPGLDDDSDVPSLRHASTRADADADADATGKDELQHAVAAETWCESRARALVESHDTASATASYQRSDPAVVAFFGAFIFLVVVLELRYRRVISLRGMRCKLRRVVDMGATVRLDGDERQLRAWTGELMPN